MDEHETYLPQRFDIEIRFNIEENAPDNYKNNWIKYVNNINIKKDFCNTLCIRAKELMNIYSNKELPLLNRLEGGLGGDSNITDKQMRFTIFFRSEKSEYFITLFPYNSSNGEDKWTFEKLGDIIQSFESVFNKDMMCECVKGLIILENRK